MVAPLNVYKASAGSGKTFTLATEYISLLVENPMSYRSILAVTFTNKATEEMKMRILSQLYGIWKQLPDSDDYLKKVQENTGLDTCVISERAGISLSYLLNNYNNFRVETIDTFFQSVMRNMARELDLTTNLRIGLNDYQVEELAVDQLIADLSTTDAMLQWILRYIMENMSSLTTVPVLYETLPDGSPIFSQATDAIHFRNVADTLSKIYPESRYVKALEKEAERRASLLAIHTQIKNAEETSYIDINLPDIKGEKSSLSNVKGKVVMVYFWAAGLAEQKMFNLDVIKPVYEDFHGKGFDIYAVSLDADKSLWASVVKNQKLPWVNVCDGLGTASQVVGTYNVTSIPSLFFLVNGELVAGTGVKDEASLRAFLKKNL